MVDYLHELKYYLSDPTEVEAVQQFFAQRWQVNFNHSQRQRDRYILPASLECLEAGQYLIGDFARQILSNDEFVREYAESEY